MTTCPRTQEQCFDPECGKTFSICKPTSRPLLFHYPQPERSIPISKIEELLKELDLMDKNYENWCKTALTDVMDNYYHSNSKHEWLVLKLKDLIK